MQIFIYFFFKYFCECNKHAGGNKWSAVNNHWSSEYDGLGCKCRQTCHSNSRALTIMTLRVSYCSIILQSSGCQSYLNLNPWQHDDNCASHFSFTFHSGRITRGHHVASLVPYSQVGQWHVWTSY